MDIRCCKCGQSIADDEKFVRIREDRTKREMVVAHFRCAPGQGVERTMSAKYRHAIAEY